MLTAWYFICYIVEINKENTFEFHTNQAIVFFFSPHFLHWSAVLILNQHNDDNGDDTSVSDTLLCYVQ